MDGDQRVDWDPFRSVTHVDGLPSEQPTRRAFEIRCPGVRCSQRPYRSDLDRLQTLLDRLTSDRRSVMR